MNAPPGRAYYESLIDPERLLVVPKEPTPEFRKKIVAEARKLGLLPEKAGDLHGGESHVWQSARSIRIKQDLRITVDDCELEPDGTLLLKQELRFRPGRRHRRPRHSITQSDRQIWLHGRGAKDNSRALLQALHKAGITALTSYVYTMPDRPKMRQRFAADPWNVMVTFTPHCNGDDLRERLSDLLKLEPGPGPWYDAHVLKLLDHYELYEKFTKIAGDQAKLSFHGIPLVLPKATLPTLPNDLAYGDIQHEYLELINAPAMWSRISAWDALSTNALKPVVIFLIDSGVGVPAHAEAPVDVANSVLIDLTTTLPVPGCTPFAGDTHGTQMASIIGAAWLNGNMAGVTGLAAGTITLRSLRCASLYDIRRALTYAAGHVPSGATGVVVIGIDVLTLYACSVNNPVFAPEAARFRAELANVTITGPTKLLVVVPSGNKDPTSAGDPEEIPLQPPPADLNLAGTIVVGACELSTARWNDTDGCSRFGDGLTLLAPGVDIYGVLTVPPPSLSFGTDSGTSFAAAHVAAVGALMRSINETLSPTQLKNSVIGCCGDSISPDEECGEGVLDGDEAIRLVIPPGTAPP